MSKKQSPAYPRASVGKARQWLEQMRTSGSGYYEPAAMTQVAAVLRNTRTSGAFSAKWRTMKQYGLLDVEGENCLVTALGQRLVESDSSGGERRLAFWEAANNYDVFADLLRDKIDAPFDRIKEYLVSNKRFTDRGAEQCARVFISHLDEYSKLTTADASENNASTSNRSSRSGEASPETMSVPVMLEPGLMAEVVLPAAMTKERWARLLSVLKIYAE